MSFKVNQPLNILLVSCESQELLKRDRFPTEKQLYEVLSKSREDYFFNEIGAQSEKDIWLDQYDGIIIGGSSSSVLKEEKRMWNLRLLIRQAIAQDKPLLWVCFWSQIIAQTLGAKVFSSSVWEVGIVNIKLTEKGETDDLFSSLSKTMKVISAHEDNILWDESIWTVLAKNSYSDCQSFWIWEWIRGVQFHPEYSLKTLNQLENIIGLELTSPQEYDGEKIIDNFLKHFVYRKKYS